MSLSTSKEASNSDVSVIKAPRRCCGTVPAWHCAEESALLMSPPVWSIPGGGGGVSTTTCSESNPNAHTAGLKFAFGSPVTAVCIPPTVGTAAASAAATMAVATAAAPPVNDDTEAAASPFTGFAENAGGGDPRASGATASDALTGRPPWMVSSVHRDEDLVTAVERRPLISAAAAPDGGCTRARFPARRAEAFAVGIPPP